MNDVIELREDGRGEIIELCGRTERSTSYAERDHRAMREAGSFWERVLVSQYVGLLYVLQRVGRAESAETVASSVATDVRTVILTT